MGAQIGRFLPLFFAYYEKMYKKAFLAGRSEEFYRRGPITTQTCGICQSRVILLVRGRSFKAPAKFFRHLSALLCIGAFKVSRFSTIQNTRMVRNCGVSDWKLSAVVNVRRDIELILKFNDSFEVFY